MKIAIPNFPEADSFVDNVTWTLRSMGHEVITPKQVIGRSRSKVLNIANELWQKAFPENWTDSEKWVLAIAKNNKIDLVLCLTQSMRQEVLETLKDYGVSHLIAWWGDTPANMRGLGLLASGWDKIFIKDSMAVKKFKAVGLNADYLHEAMNPKWHRRLFKGVNSEVVVAGSYYGYRQYIVSALIQRSVPMALYGAKPPRWASEDVKTSHRSRFVVKDDKSLIFGSGLACLNSTALSEGNSLNCRAFEIAGACGLQLIENRSVVSECFDPESEVLIYNSVEEILEHLERASKEPKWAMKVREAGFNRAHAHHTYEHRLEHLLASV